MSAMDTAPPTNRSEPPFIANERDMLEGWLDYHRQTLQWKCHGLTDSQLKERSVPPSDMSLLGLVRHMTEVERGWFADFAGGDTTDVYCTAENRNLDFDGVDTADPAADIERLRVEIETCRQLTAGHQLDDIQVDDRGRHISLRWIYTHMIEEYARHNGHADLLRERIDGATGD